MDSVFFQFIVRLRSRPQSSSRNTRYTREGNDGNGDPILVGQAIRLCSLDSDGKFDMREVFGVKARGFPGSAQRRGYDRSPEV